MQAYIDVPIDIRYNTDMHVYVHIHIHLQFIHSAATPYRNTYIFLASPVEKMYLDAKSYSQFTCKCWPRFV